ncbi:hypothetical protein J2125_000171 [Erwinia toletana]|uniref:YmiA family membrane protein n=1 Tax=Winslowiella toletana TaxID=92490 RepID=A0ABS4P2U3_9GAMM|nr:hypothetical protein [Winslowiella toletana]
MLTKRAAWSLVFICCAIFWLLVAVAWIMYM